MSVGSTYLDESAPQTGFPQGTPEKSVITYLLGPPTRGVDGIAFAKVAADKGLTREKFWIQVVARNAEQLLESNAEGRSILDDIFSEALGQLVTLWEVGGTLESHADRRFPGITIQSERVIDALGRPPVCRLVDREILSRIADALMGFTGADWAICSISDGRSDYRFPILRKGPKEGSCDG